MANFGMTPVAVEQFNRLRALWNAFKLLPFPDVGDDASLEAAWAGVRDDLFVFDESAGWVSQVSAGRTIEERFLQPDRELERRVTALATADPTGAPMLDYVRTLNELLVLAATVSLSLPDTDAWRSRAPENPVHEAVAEHCEGLVSGEIFGVLHVVSDEALKGFARLSERGGMDGAIESFAIEAHVTRGHDHLFTIRFLPGDFAVVETWRPEYGVWTIVEVAAR